MKFKLSHDNYKHILKVFLYSAGSAVVAVMITMLGQLEIPQHLLFLVPLVNMILVSVKEFLSEER